MEYRTLDLTLISAKGLKKSHLNKMEVYAVASISGSNHDNFYKYRTPVDKQGGSQPTWNHPIKFNIQESLAQQNRLTLVIKIKSVGMIWDKKLGEVKVPIKDLFEGVTKQGKPMQNTSYQITRPSAKHEGILNFSFKFGEIFQEPVTAYPVASAGVGVYPPQQAPFYGGYPAQAPPPVGYGGYPHPPPVYGGYAQQRPVASRSNYNGLGMGLGAGLLGGLLISDIASHGGGGCGGGGCGGGCGGGGCGGGCGG